MSILLQQKYLHLHPIWTLRLKLCTHWKEFICLSPLFKRHLQLKKPTQPSLANATQQSDSVINPIQEENSPILKLINPLIVSSSDEVEILCCSQSQDDVNIKDRPCTRTGSGTTKEIQGNDVPATSSEHGCSKPTIGLQFWDLFLSLLNQQLLVNESYKDLQYWQVLE